MGASALWVALAQFHACRLVANGVRMFLLPGRGSPLRKKLAEWRAKWETVEGGGVVVVVRR